MEIPAGGGQERIEFAVNHDVVELHVKFAEYERVLQNLIELDRRPVGLLLACKTEQILDDVVRALRLLVELFEIFRAARVNELLRFQELAISKDGGERIVQL